MDCSRSRFSFSSNIGCMLPNLNAHSLALCVKFLRVRESNMSSNSKAWHQVSADIHPMTGLDGRRYARSEVIGKL